MKNKKMKTIDGNTAAAHIAYAFSEICAIYPITPSTTMAELVDEWSAMGRKNIFGDEVVVIEMQSEAGAAGTLHGALSAGSFCSTFTASQGLLLMIPNMYKIAGELMPVVFHVSARALATHALSIFGDHQDVMATRATGFAMLCSSSVQEAMDLALVSHLSTIRSSVPFLHFFDGFRTSHEIQKIETIEYDDIKKLVDNKKIKEHREKALNPNSPVLKGSAQNPDVYFQAAEGVNAYYLRIPKIVEEEMDKVFKLTGRKYNLFDYVGAKDAEKIIIMMGSGAEAVEETIEYLKKEKLGLLKVRLFRPFSKEHFLNAIPKTVKKIAVLDRTKENGALGEPLYLDVASAFENISSKPLIVGGRYGLGSKEFTPSMVKAVFDNLDQKEPKNHFTVGIEDDVTFTSLVQKDNLSLESGVNCKFFGLGGDGTVGANKDAIKIIGDNTDKYVQGYFSYDSKKSYGLTVSHLRISDKPIKSTYLIQEPSYVACHEASFVGQYDLLKGIKEKGTFVLNCPWNFEEIEKHLPNSLKKTIAEKKIAFYTVDAEDVAEKVGLGRKINMVMQTVFFKLSNIIPIENAIEYLNMAIEHTYGNKGEEVVAKNKAAVEQAIAKLYPVKYPESWKNLKDEEKEIDLSRPSFIRQVADVMNSQEGDSLPVSALAPGGVFPTGTTKWEKRNIALHLPKWIPQNCIQCAQCSFVCPHAVIRPFLMTKDEKDKAPEGYEGIKAIGKNMENYSFSIEVSSYDCKSKQNFLSTPFL
jgi:pyruvate-ferredoxin/flavodoxin oxidoreductase